MSSRSTGVQLLLSFTYLVTLANCNKSGNTATDAIDQNSMTNLEQLNSSRASSSSSSVKGCEYESYIYENGTVAKSANSNYPQNYICNNSRWGLTDQQTSIGCKTDDLQYIVTNGAFRFNKTTNLNEQCNTQSKSFKSVTPSVTRYVRSNSESLIPANSGPVQVINPIANGETHLPGCAGKSTSTQPRSCKNNGSIENEVYAVKLTTEYLTSEELRPRFILGITDGPMLNVQPIFQKFVMSVSETPGDFFPENDACKKLGGYYPNTNIFEAGVGDARINLMNSDFSLDDLAKIDGERVAAYKTATTSHSTEAINAYNAKVKEYKLAKLALEDGMNNRLCLIDPGKTYYVNIRPLNPGCMADVNGNGVMQASPVPCRMEALTHQLEHP